MGFTKKDKDYSALGRRARTSLSEYIDAFTFGSGETITVGNSNTLDLTITRGVRKTDGAGNALQIQGGMAQGTNQVGGGVNIYTGYPTGNAAAGDFKVFGALSKGSSGTSVNPSNSTMLSVSGDTGNVVVNGSLTIGSTEVINSSAQVSASAIPALNQNTTGNAATATALETARNIAGVSFDGTADISLNNNAITNGAGYTTNVGDITRVSLSADTGGTTTIDTGNADITITGGEGVDTTLSSMEVTITVKQIVVTHHHFFMNSTSTSADFFFPYNNLNEASSTSQYYTRTIAPYDGRIIKVLIRPSAGIGTACKLQFHKITDTTLNFGTAVEEVTNVNLNTAETSVSTAFSSATFSAGDVVNVSLIKSDSATANIQAVIVWEYTT